MPNQHWLLRRVVFFHLHSTFNSVLIMDEPATLWSESGVNVSPESQEDSGESTSVKPDSTKEPQQEQVKNYFSENNNTQKRKAEEVIDLMDSGDEEEPKRLITAKPPRTAIPHQLPDWMRAARPQANRIAERAHYISFPTNFVPDWHHLLPPRPLVSQNPTPSSIKQYTPVAFELTLLNVNDFTIEAIDQYGGRSSELQGLRKPIRQICAQHNVRAVRDSDKWRIPLPAYQDVLIFLSHRYRVVGVPPTQLQIAALERERQEKDYPDAATLESYGIPALIAKTLAPFQRGGVDFVREKDGRALIADELRSSQHSDLFLTKYLSEWDSGNPFNQWPA